MGLILFSGLNFCWTVRYIATHESTTGKVIDGTTTYAGSTENGGSVSRATAAVIEYELPDGKKTTFCSRRTNSDVQPPRGLDYQSELTVYYDLDNPYEARAGDFLSLWGITVSLLAAGAISLASPNLLSRVSGST